MGGIDFENTLKAIKKLNLEVSIKEFGFYQIGEKVPIKNVKVNDFLDEVLKENSRITKVLETLAQAEQIKAKWAGGGY